LEIKKESVAPLSFPFTGIFQLSISMLPVKLVKEF